MLKFLNSVLPSKIKSSFKDPLKFFIAQNTQHHHTEMMQVYSLLRLQNLIPAIPPAHLQARVSGGYDGNFFWNGNRMINDYEAALALVGKKMDDFDKILDFGTGCGRLLIPLSLRVNPGKLYGTDIDPEAIDWFRNEYPTIGGLDCNPHRPPMNYADHTFDMVFATSVFTHLPEDMQFEWLAELKRITKPGGYLLLTFHGDYATNRTMSRLVIDSTQKNGFYYASADVELVSGLPVFYQNTFHTSEYVMKEWGKYFEIIQTIPQGMGNNQDIAVCRVR
jgi:SAM-dependent methyltransferase